MAQNPTDSLSSHQSPNVTNLIDFKNRFQSQDTDKNCIDHMKPPGSKLAVCSRDHVERLKMKRLESKKHSLKAPQPIRHRDVSTIKILTYFPIDECF